MKKVGKLVAKSALFGAGFTVGAVTAIIVLQIIANVLTNL